MGSPPQGGPVWASGPGLAPQVSSPDLSSRASVQLPLSTGGSTVGDWHWVTSVRSGRYILFWALP